MKGRYEMGRFQDKVAIVTGACGGTGRWVSKILAEEGAKVVMVDIDEERGNAFVDEITSNGGTAIFMKTDCTKGEAIKATVDAAAEKSGQINLLFNIATVMGYEQGLFCDITEEIFDKEITINLKCHYHFLRFTIPYMIKNGGGTIVCFSSAAARAGDLGATIYGAAKAGVEVMVKCIATQYGKFGIRINCVRPGVMWKEEFLERAKQPGSPSAVHLKVFEDNNFVTRFGVGKDGAKVALFFADDQQSGFVQGQVLDMDGGCSAAAVTWRDQSRNANISEYITEKYLK